MSSKSRRKARRAKEFKRQCAQSRVNARKLLSPDGPARLYKRKDRQVLFPVPGTKQGYKHREKRFAKSRVINAARLANLLIELIQVTQGSPVVITRLDFLGSSVPFIAGGRAEVAGVELAWDFRFRFDRAFLEVGTVRENWEGPLESVILSSSQDGVTGEPYEGYLTDREAVILLGKLFTALAAPVKGSSFSERLGNTLDVLSGAGDVTAPTLFTEHKTA